MCVSFYTLTSAIIYIHIYQHKFRLVYDVVFLKKNNVVENIIYKGFMHYMLQ